MQIDFDFIGFGNAIYWRRKENKQTLTELGYELKICKETIRRIEKHKLTNIEIKTFNILCGFIGHHPEAYFIIQYNK